MQKAWSFLCFVQVLCKLLSKGLTNKTIHDIMHAGAWRGEAFQCLLIVYHFIIFISEYKSIDWSECIDYQFKIVSIGKKLWLAHKCKINLPNYTTIANRLANILEKIAIEKISAVMTNVKELREDMRKADAFFKNNDEKLDDEISEDMEYTYIPFDTQWRPEASALKACRPSNSISSLLHVPSTLLEACPRTPAGLLPSPLHSSPSPCHMLREAFPSSL